MMRTLGNVPCWSVKLIQGYTAKRTENVCLFQDKGTRGVHPKGYRLIDGNIYQVTVQLVAVTGRLDSDTARYM